MEVSLTSTGEGKVVAHEESSSSEASSTSKVVEEHGVTKQIQESSQKEEHSLMEQRVSESVSSSTKTSMQSFSSVSQSVSSSTSISSSSLNTSSLQMSEEALKMLQSAEEQKKASEAPLDNNGNQVDQQKQTNGTECNGVQEIQQENIRNTLHEIINEIETETSKDANKENQQTQGYQNGGSAETNGQLGEEQDEAYVPKKIDLEKLFTPASDSGEITPQQRNRKLFSSSSFYASCHPTVQEQVQLAHKISASLYDTTNQQSKGQSMYVNRMKRSVKWVHESQGQTEDASGRGEGQRPATPTTADVMGNYKIPSKEVNLSLVMNPHGQIHDINSLRKQGLKIEPTQVNPEVCFDLVKDLNSPCGKGAELFAKRRKRAEKWVVDENNVQKQLQEAQAAARASPKLPPPSVIDQGRVQREQEMANIQDKYVQPRLKMVQSPWEAALQTGSVNNAFQEIKRAPPTHQQVLDTVVQRASEQQTTTTLSTSSSTLSQQKQMTFQSNTLPPQTRSFQAPSPLPTRAYAPSPTPSGLTYSQQFSQTPQPSPAFKQPLPPTPKTPYNPPPALTSRVNVDALLKPRLPKAWDPNAFNSLPRNFGSTVAPIPRVAAQPERQPVQPAFVSQQEPASNPPVPPFQPQTNETPAALPNYIFSPISSTPAPRPFTPQTLPQVPQPQSELEIRKRMEEIKSEIATKAEQFQTKKEESTTVISHQQESVQQEFVQEQQVVQQTEQQIVQQTEQQIIQQTEQQVIQESTTVSSSEQTFVEQKTESSVVATQEVVQQTAEEPRTDIPVQDAAPATEAQVPAPEPQATVVEEAAPTPAQAPAEIQVVEAAVPEQTQPEVVQEPVAQQPIAEQPAQFDQQPVETEGEAPFTGVEKLEEIIRQEAQMQQFQQESISQESIRQQTQSEQSITQQSFSQQQTFSQQQQTFSQQQQSFSQQQQSFSQQQTLSQQQQQQTISQESYGQQQFVEQQQQIEQFEQQRQQAFEQQTQQLLASQQLLQNQVIAQQQAFARQQIAEAIAQQQEGDEYEKIPVKQLIQTFDPNHVYQPKPIKKQAPPEPIIQSDQQLPDYLHAQQPTNFSIQYTQPQGIYFVADTCCETRQFFEEEQNLLQQQQQQYAYEQQQQQLAYEQQLQSYQYQQSLQQQQQYQYEQQQQSLEAYQIESTSSYSQQQEAQLQYQYQQQQNEQITRNQTFSQAKDIINQIEQQTRQQSALQQKGLQNGSGANQVTVDEAQVTQSSSESAERLRQQIQSGNNYNTAARGWGKQFDFYRPVTFNAKSVIA